MIFARFKTKALKFGGILTLDKYIILWAIAFGLLRSRAQAYRVIYDAVKTPRSDVDYSLSPPPRSSVRTACARTQVTFGPATPAPAPVDRPMDTG